MDCTVRREFAFPWAATMFWVVRNTSASALTTDALRWSAPSNRTLERENGSLAETSSAQIGQTLYESPRPPRQASQRAMRRDCFHKQGAATSIHGGSSAKLQGTRALVSCLRPSGHTGVIRRRQASAASSPELSPDGEKGALLFRDTGNRYARREQRFR